MALDTALAAPERVAGLVLLGPVVSGAPDPGLNAAEKRFEALLDEAMESGNLEEVNRLETWALAGMVPPGRKAGWAVRRGRWPWT